jgi:hypothetical protein
MGISYAWLPKPIVPCNSFSMENPTGLLLYRIFREMLDNVVVGLRNKITLKKNLKLGMHKSFFLLFYYSYVHTRLGSFLPPAPTPSLTRVVFLKSFLFVIFK